MMHKFQHQKFWRLSLGLLLIGIGQRLFYTGAVLPWVNDTTLPLTWIVTSMICFLLGFMCVLPLAIWFYKTYRSDERLLKLIGFYLLFACLLGVVIGGLGQLLYELTSFTYATVQIGIWVSSTISQNLLKLIFCFGLVSIYKQLPIGKRMCLVRLPLVVVGVLTVGTLFLTVCLPEISSLLTSVIDAVLLIAILYYFMYLMKEKKDEKVS